MQKNTDIDITFLNAREKRSLSIKNYLYKA